MENFLSLGGMALMIISGLGIIYYGFFWLLAISGQAGAKMSKGTQFENKDTDINIAKNKEFMKDLQGKVIRGMIGFAIGGMLYLIYELVYSK